MSTELRARTDPRDHMVQFYADVTDLERVVSRYLHDGLRAGGTAFVAATGPHVRALTRALGDLGSGSEQEGWSGRLITIDAVDVAARLGAGAASDGVVFEGLVAEPLRRAAAGGRPLFVFGEIVAVLWETGRVVAAIDLEDRWNRLRSEIDFSLLCAYPLASVEGRQHASALSEVCHLHSAVIGSVPVGELGRDLEEEDVASETVARHLVRSPLAPRYARELVVQTLDRWGLAALTQDATLVVSELAANAVVHARSDLTVTVTRTPGAVRIAVHDDSLVAPSPQEPARTLSSGRGMRLVSAIADEWGSDITGEGKTVWADLATAPGSVAQIT